MLPAIEKLVKNLKPKYDDDAIDRLNYAYTSSFFVLLIIVIGAKQYVGEPLQCWMSAEFKNNWEKYIENYCFVENTYYVGFEQTKLPNMADRQRLELQYYQWVPLLLIIQLLCFLGPKTFWGAVSWKTGLSVKALIGSEISHGERQKKILSHKNKGDENSEPKTYARQMRQVILFNQNRTTHICGWSIRYNSYFTLVYMVYKILNCVNTIGQLVIMNQFLNTNYMFWGWGMLQDLIYNRDWRSSGLFPRVTYCDFMRRDDASSKPMNFTVQCVLMINMFNEKLYVILWFWFVALSILNLINLFYWLIISLVDECKFYFIQCQLNFAGEKYNDSEIPDFVKHYITLDGVTAIRLISANCGDLTSSEIVAAMFEDHKKEKNSAKAKKEKEDAEKEMPSKKDDDPMLENVTFTNGNNGPEKKDTNLLDPRNPKQSKIYPAQSSSPVPMSFSNNTYVEAEELPKKEDPNSWLENVTPNVAGNGPPPGFERRSQTPIAPSDDETHGSPSRPYNTVSGYGYNAPPGVYNPTGDLPFRSHYPNLVEQIPEDAMIRPVLSTGNISLG